MGFCYTIMEDFPYFIYEDNSEDAKDNYCEVFCNETNP